MVWQPWPGLFIGLHIHCLVVSLARTNQQNGDPPPWCVTAIQGLKPADRGLFFVREAVYIYSMQDMGNSVETMRRPLGLVVVVVGPRTLKNREAILAALDKAHKKAPRRGLGRGHVDQPGGCMNGIRAFAAFTRTRSGAAVWLTSAKSHFSGQSVMGRSSIRRGLLRLPAGLPAPLRWPPCPAMIC